MAIIIRKAINVQGDHLMLPTTGLSVVGFGITGTWTGTLTFRYSNDGLNFFTGSVLPFAVASGLVTQQTTTVNGNFQAQVANLAAWDVIATTLKSGTAVITIAASSDGSWQDAFLAASSLFVEQDVTGGATNVITVAAQANRAWRVRTVAGGFSVAPGAAVKLTVEDGGSTILWAQWLAASAGPFSLTLPADPDNPPVSGGGVTNTPGNSMVVRLAAPGGSVTSSLSAEVIPA